MLKKAFPWYRSEPDKRDSKVVLEGKKVVLREKRIEDAPDDYAWRMDEELARLDASRPLKMAYEEFLKYTKEELSFPGSRSRRFAIDTPNGKHIGNCMCYDIDIRKGEAELGIMIGDREYWEKGYGTDSVKSLLKYAFESMKLRRVYLHTLEWNCRARAAFAKSGFREVKPVRQSGMDFVLMEVKRSDWSQDKKVTGSGDNVQPVESPIAHPCS